MRCENTGSLEASYGVEAIRLLVGRGVTTRDAIERPHAQQWAVCGHRGRGNRTVSFPSRWPGHSLSSRAASLSAVRTDRRVRPPWCRRLTVHASARKVA